MAVSSEPLDYQGSALQQGGDYMQLNGEIFEADTALEFLAYLGAHRYVQA